MLRNAKLSCGVSYTTLDLPVRYITVAELRDYAEHDQIGQLIVHGTRHRDSGRITYSLVVRVLWRDEEHLLVAHHERTPREWTSLDRLIAFLDRDRMKYREMMVKFNEVEENND